jgi:hypothetical protein
MLELKDAFVVMRKVLSGLLDFEQFADNTTHNYDELFNDF